MKLPQDIASRWSVESDRKELHDGDSVYYAPDGVVHRITRVTDSELILFDTWQNETWTIEKQQWESLLYSDVFPLE